ncbi:hypothetical protein F7725_017861 [Dissostichus mawsoni]|uniref:Uncharacterized protein n=1 Tax=Dissostichus mawsoni TaxID=36200 RepID=A0A7J5XPX2_DISMA|nr:hypothetical protein F7725_017861 [Dissostichus mawsoni]
MKPFPVQVDHAAPLTHSPSVRKSAAPCKYHSALINQGRLQLHYVPGVNIQRATPLAFSASSWRRYGPHNLIHKGPHHQPQRFDGQVHKRGSKVRIGGFWCESKVEGLLLFTSSSEPSFVCRNVPLLGHSVGFWRETPRQRVCQDKIGVCPNLSTFVSRLPVLVLRGNSALRAETKWPQKL